MRGPLSSLLERRRALLSLSLSLEPQYVSAQLIRYAMFVLLRGGGGGGGEVVCPDVGAGGWTRRWSW